MNKISISYSELWDYDLHNLGPRMITRDVNNFEVKLLETMKYKVVDKVWFGSLIQFEIVSRSGPMICKLPYHSVTDLSKHMDI